MWVNLIAWRRIRGPEPSKLTLGYPTNSLESSSATGFVHGFTAVRARRRTSFGPEEVMREQAVGSAGDRPLEFGGCVLLLGACHVCPLSGLARVSGQPAFEMCWP
jgi:hypothetical protein